MIINLVRRWDFYDRETLKNIFSTDPTVSRCSIMCCTITNLSQGLAVLEGGKGGHGALVQS